MDKLKAKSNHRRCNNLLNKVEDNFFRKTIKRMEKDLKGTECEANIKAMQKALDTFVENVEEIGFLMEMVIDEECGLDISLEPSRIPLVELEKN
jgi:hypothetical protein